MAGRRWVFARIADLRRTMATRCYPVEKAGSKEDAKNAGGEEEYEGDEDDEEDMLPVQLFPLHLLVQAVEVEDDHEGDDEEEDYMEGDIEDDTLSALTIPTSTTKEYVCIRVRRRETDVNALATGVAALTVVQSGDIEIQSLP